MRLVSQLRARHVHRDRRTLSKRIRMPGYDHQLKASENRAGPMGECDPSTIKGRVGIARVMRDLTIEELDLLVGHRGFYAKHIRRDIMMLGEWYHCQPATRKRCLERSWKAVSILAPLLNTTPEELWGDNPRAST